MEFRPGTCSACKASFKIPASFTANKAKCSKCGGTVEIGPVTSDDAAPEKPATPQPAQAISAPVAGAAARLAAQPEAARPVPAKPIAARPPAPAPAAKPGVPPIPHTAPPARPAPVAAPQAAPVTPLKVASSAPRVAPGAPVKTPASSVPKSASIAPAKVAPLAAAKTSPSSAKSGSARGAKTNDDGGRGERRKHLEKKQGNPLLVGGALVLFVIVGGGLYLAYSKNKAKETALQAKHAEELKVKQDAEAKVEAERVKAAEAEQAAALKKDEEKAAKSGKADASGAVLAAETNPAAKVADPAAAKPKEPAANKPVEGYDLSTIADFGPAEGTTPEQWTELQALAATMVDMSAGARSSKARDKLSLTPKESFPAILNQFKKLNIAEEDGFRAADMTQKALEKMCHGNNFGWRYQQENEYVHWDQQVIKKWCDAWTKASTDPEYWKKLTKTTESGDKPDSGTQKPDDF